MYVHINLETGLILQCTCSWLVQFIRITNNVVPVCTLSGLNYHGIKFDTRWRIMIIHVLLKSKIMDKMQFCYSLVCMLVTSSTFAGKSSYMYLCQCSKITSKTLWGLRGGHFAIVIFPLNHALPGVINPGSSICASHPLGSIYLTTNSSQLSSTYFRYTLIQCNPST